jgi:hypothetical protein
MFAIFALLMIAVYMTQREPERYLWLFLTVYYITGFASFILGTLPLPLGFVLGLIFLRRKERVNKTAKYLALIFGLVYLALSRTVPDLSFTEMNQLRNQYELSKKLGQVQAVHSYTSKSEIQSLIVKRLLDTKDVRKMTIDDALLMFRVWVLQHRGLSVKDVKWLANEAPFELKFFWSSHRENGFKTSYETIAFGNYVYYGVFKTSNDGTIYLDTVFEYIGNHAGFIP